MINSENSPTKQEIEHFLTEIKFALPNGFIDFFEKSNGASLSNDENNIFLWALTDMVKLNRDYNVEEYAPEFFIFGSDGGDLAYAVEKSSGYIFEMPFIGMSKEEATFKCKTFDEFIEDYR